MSYTHYTSLKNKVVLITGGASGIGAEMVKAFAVQDCIVYFLDCDQVAGEKLCSELNNDQVIFLYCDVSNVEELKSVLDRALNAHQKVDVLINNAANDQRMDFQSITEDDWTNSLALNLTPMFMAAQKLSPHMIKAGGGVIINFGSINALFGPAQLVAYNTAKAGVVGLTKSLATELGGNNIRVNAIIPGWVATEKQLQSWLTPEAEAEWTKGMCLNKRIAPGDIAKLALFLASDDSSMVTSQQLVLDGGWI